MMHPPLRSGRLSTYDGGDRPKYSPQEVGMTPTRTAVTVSMIASSRRRLLRLAAAGALMTAVGGAAPVVRAQTPFPTRLRVLHASPALGKVEIDFNGKEELDEFTYGMVSDWIEVTP